MTAAIWIAGLKCWWWCLWRTFTHPAPCQGRAFTRANGEAAQVDVIAAVTSDWRVLRVFYERSPGLAERRFAEIRDSVYV
jgi:hypothetical protein